MTTFFPFRKTLPSIRYIGTSSLVSFAKYENIHTGLETAFIDYGSGNFHQGCHKAKFKKGDILVIKPDKDFVIESNKAKLDFHYIGFDFHALKKRQSLNQEESLLLSCYQTINDADNLIPASSSTATLGELLKKIHAETLNMESILTILGKGCCLEYIAVLAQFIRSENSGRNNLVKRNSQLVENTYEFISKNYHKKLSLHDLAGNVFLSPYHFSRIFKKYTGYSPVQYLNIYRTEKAKELLENNNMTFAEIAEESGLKNAYYFSTVFKKIQGVSPVQYKNAIITHSSSINQK